MAYDAILILGGGVREGGELPAWSKSRFDLALKRAQGEFFVCLGFFLAIFSAMGHGSFWRHDAGKALLHCELVN